MTYINTEVIQHTCLPRPNSGIKMNEERFNILNSSFFFLRILFLLAYKRSVSTHIS